MLALMRCRVRAAVVGGTWGETDDVVCERGGRYGRRVESETPVVVCVSARRYLGTLEFHVAVVCMRVCVGYGVESFGERQFLSSEHYRP